MNGLPALTWRAWLRECSLPLGVGTLAAASGAIILALIGVPASLIGVLWAFGLLAVGFVVAYGYLRRRRYYRALAEALDSLEHSWYLPSLVEEPDFFDGQASWNLALLLSRMGSAEVELEREGVRAYRDFVEAWIHEIKTPVAASTLVLDRMHGADALTLKRELERINAAAQQALYFARSTNLHGDYAISEVELASACRQALRTNAQLLIEHGVQPHLDGVEGYSVLADESWLAFMISQIVVNSAKYGASELSFDAQIRAAGTSQEHTLLTIIDNGVGISAADVPHVAERGFVGANGRAEGSATGMGLYLVATLSERMGLGFALHSTEGEGTTVSLSFPHERGRREFTRQIEPQKVTDASS